MVASAQGQRTGHVERADLGNNITTEKVESVSRAGGKFGNIVPRTHQCAEQIDRRLLEGEIRPRPMGGRAREGPDRHLHLPNVQNTSGPVRSVLPTVRTREEQSYQRQQGENDKRQLDQGQAPSVMGTRRECRVLDQWRCFGLRSSGALGKNSGRTNRFRIANNEDLKEFQNELRNRVKVTLV